MSLKIFKNIICACLLVILAGCFSDDHEGTFNDTSATEQNDQHLSGIQTIKSNIQGSAASFHVIEPATIVAISGDGTTISTSTTLDGKFDFGALSLNNSYVLFLVPNVDSELNWDGDVQAAIVLSQPSTDELVAVKTKVLGTIAKSQDALAVNPITTALALKLFKDLSVNLIQFAKLYSNDPVTNTNLLTEYNQILAAIVSAQMTDALNELVKSWGVDSSNKNLIATSLFDFSNYSPRSNLNQEASMDHFFIEILGLTFGRDNLGQALINQTKVNQLASSNLLIDKGFQEGIVFVSFCKTRLNSNNSTISDLLDSFLNVDIALPQYVASLQSIVNQLISEETGLNKSEDEILAKIKFMISSQQIPYP